MSSDKIDIHLDIEDDTKNNDDENWKILYTTFFIIGVFVFFWLLVAVFNSDDVTVTVVEEKED
ncbi:MAG TPA: hypothetical protein VLG50_07975 [Candidatus Saccharimonadales bacterium]|nr:hypothetical protein [Candidatus Saccharimonadales bacterium]